MFSTFFALCITKFLVSSSQDKLQIGFAYKKQVRIFDSYIMSEMSENALMMDSLVNFIWLKSMAGFGPNLNSHPMF